MPTDTADELVPPASNKKSNPLDEATKKYFAIYENEKARKLFPERGGQPYKPSWYNVFFKGEGREPQEKFRCEVNVYNCTQKSPLVKLMMGALKASGCPINLRRHISCEKCDTCVTGGYDPHLNQIVVCQNTAASENKVQGVLAHEMIHMFDYCRHKLDLTNLKHLACTEIRAANLVHCSFMSSIIYGTASFWNIKERHRECVRRRAVESVLAVREVNYLEAFEVVDSVFDKCYADLEPIGRRLRRNSDHILKAYQERLDMGYD